MSRTGCQQDGDETGHHDLAGTDNESGTEQGTHLESNRDKARIIAPRARRKPMLSNPSPSVR